MNGKNREREPVYSNFPHSSGKRDSELYIMIRMVVVIMEEIMKIVVDVTTLVQYRE